MPRAGGRRVARLSPHRAWISGWLVAILASLLIPSAPAQAQPAVRRIGFLGMDSRMQGFRVDAFRERLRDLGYEDGRNLSIEIRWAEGDFDRLPALAAELAALNVEVLVTAAPPAVRAAQRATQTIPIVGRFHDPVGLGFVSCLLLDGLIFLLV